MKNTEPGAKTCTIDGCEKPVLARSLCANHYKQQYRNEKRLGTWQNSMVPKKGLTCTAANCDRPRRAKGLCTKHYEETRRHLRGRCDIAGCNNQEKHNGLCSTHYKRLKKHGTTDKVEKVYTTCQDKACALRARTNGYCQKHYAAWAKYGIPNIAEKKERNECLIGTCEHQAVKTHLCRTHHWDFYEHQNQDIQTYIDYVYALNTQKITEVFA